jgi:hypothetical protein
MLAVIRINKVFHNAKDEKKMTGTLGMLGLIFHFNYFEIILLFIV